MGLIERARRRLWVLRDGVKNKVFGKSHRERVFSKIYEKNLWKEDESRSGIGSNRAATERVRAELPALMDRFGCRSLLDAPCGDFVWMKEIAPKLGRYVGADIVRELVEKNRAAHATDVISFEHADLTCDPLPQVDVILCRDCFIHLPTKSIRAALANFKRSGARYLLLTQCPDAGPYRDVAVGSFRPIDFTAAPFAFPKPLARIVEREGHELGLWDLRALT